MKKQSNSLARGLRDFFSEHLLELRGLSPHTVHSYRDSLVLLIRFVAKSQNCSVIKLDIQDLSSDQVIKFLRHLEDDRKNSVSTRNVRLAAIHTFFRYLAEKFPAQLEHCQRVLAIPFKRSRTRPVEYLEHNEIQAVLSCVGRSTRDGRRDYVLIATMFNTGARVQELLNLRCSDFQFSKPFHVRLFGKGNKERICPLWPETARLLQDLISDNGLNIHSQDRIFLNHRRQPLTRYGARYLLAKYFAVLIFAAISCVCRPLCSCRAHFVICVMIQAYHVDAAARILKGIGIEVPKRSLGPRKLVALSGGPADRV